MSSFIFRGTIKAIYDTKQISEKYKKREFVVTETNTPYPQDILFQLSQEKVDLINGLTEGVEVEVSFNLRGRGWTGQDGILKYFNSLEAWRVQAAGAPVQNYQQAANQTNSNYQSNVSPQQNSTPFVEVNQVEDDLPF